MPAGFDFQTAPQVVELSYTIWSALASGISAFFGSACILPLLPVYAVYMMGEGPLRERGPGAVKQILLRMLGFTLGFVPFFMVLGAGAGALGGMLEKYREAFPYIGGALMIIFGLMMLDVVPGIRMFSVQADARKLASGGFVKMMLLGILLAVSWLPCTSAFLFNVLLMAATEGSTAIRGMWLLFFYALGLAVPFLAFMALYSRLGGMLTFMRNHQAFIRKVAGGVLILLGVLRLFRLA